MSYWDTSCLIKLYTPEADSSLYLGYLASAATCVTSDLTPLEFWATVRRKESEGVLAVGEANTVQAALDSDFAAGAITLVMRDAAVHASYRSIVEQCHAHIPPIFIRTNDALHLAAAESAGESEIVTTDKRLREAALFLGFSVYPPP